MKANLTAISERLGISPSTVSRALRNHPSISPETRAKTIEAANEMGYSLKQSRRGRKSIKKKTLNICALIQGQSPELEQSSLTYKILGGITDAIEAAGGVCSVNFINGKDLSTKENHPRLLRDGNCDGIILTHRFQKKDVERLSKEFPCVSVNYNYKIRNLDSVNAEDTESFQKLAESLYAQGHRKIGYFDIEPDHPRAGKRAASYFQAMNALGLKTNEQAMLSSSEYPGFEAKLKKALAMTKKGVTAWMCGNDFAAARLTGSFQEKGLKVPREISLTGFGGVRLPESKIKLRTMEIPFYETGAEAVRLLLERIKFPAAPGKHVFLDCKFIKGNSISKIQ